MVRKREWSKSTSTLPEWSLTYLRVWCQEKSGQVWVNPMKMFTQEIDDCVTILPHLQSTINIIVLEATSKEGLDDFNTITTLLEYTLVPYALLIPTRKVHAVRKDGMQVIHILSPFMKNRDDIKFSWICSGLNLPHNTLLAQTPTLFVKENVEFEERFTEFLHLDQRVVRHLTTTESVCTLAQQVYAEKVVKKYAAFDLTKEEQPKTTTSVDKSCLDKYTFEKLLEISENQTEKTLAVSALKRASKHTQSSTSSGSDALTSVCIKLMEGKNHTSQRTAAQILGQTTHNQDKWQKIAGAAISTALKIDEPLKNTSRAKSIRHLINKAIIAYPEVVAVAIIDLCTMSRIPIHLSKQLEKWAFKHTTEGVATNWHQVLSTLNLASRPKVEEYGRTARSIHLEQVTHTSDPLTHLLYNVNGFSARWKSAWVSQEHETQLSKSKKIRQKWRKTAKTDFKTTVIRAGCPDIISIIESKIDLRRLMSLPGFLEWCDLQRYNHIYLTWSSNEAKGGVGYAGILVLSRYKALTSKFGLNEKQDDEARILTLEFPSFVHISVYSPCVSYTSERKDARETFDKQLCLYLRDLKQESCKPIILLGDLNVNPRRHDWHEKAFAHMAEAKAKSNSIHHPGCSPLELEGYHNILSELNGSNVWEVLHPFSTEGMTWHPPTDPHGLLEWGQRLDHFLVPDSMLNGKGLIRVQSIVNHRGVGSSDHNPLQLTLEKSHISSRQPLTSANERNINGIATVSELIATIEIKDVESGVRSHFKNIECPRVIMNINNRDTEVFIDSGSPFSIYNPPKGENTDDYYLSTGGATGSTRNCQFTGVGGGKIVAEQNYAMKIKIGHTEVMCEFVVLHQHEPSLPKFLLGMDILLGHLKGIAILPEVIKEKAYNSVIHFGVEWGLKFDCKQSKQCAVTASLKIQPKYPLLDDLDGDLTEEHLRQVCGIKIQASSYSTSDNEEEKEEGAYHQNTESDEEEEENAFLFTDPTQDKTTSKRDIKFHDSPLPVVELNLFMSKTGEDIPVDVLIDSGASLNLISQALAEKLMRKKYNIYQNNTLNEVVTSKLPSIKVASGNTIKAIGSIEAYIRFKEEISPAVIFFIFPDLPVQAIIGHATNTLWQANLSWKLRTWEVTPSLSSNPISTLWKNISGKHWRAPLQVAVARDITIPPYSHSKVKVSPPNSEQILDLGVQGTFGFIAPSHNQGNYLVAHGVANSPTWVQVANITGKNLEFKKGHLVCEFHPREECVVNKIDINPTQQDYQQKKLKNQQAIIKSNYTKKQHQAKADDWCGKITSTKEQSSRKSPLNGTTLDSKLTPRVLPWEGVSKGTDHTWTKLNHEGGSGSRMNIVETRVVSSQVQDITKKLNRTGSEHVRPFGVKGISETATTSLSVSIVTTPTPSRCVEVVLNSGIPHSVSPYPPARSFGISSSGRGNEAVRMMSEEPLSVEIGPAHVPLHTARVASSGSRLRPHIQSKPSDTEEQARPQKKGGSKLIIPQCVVQSENKIIHKDDKKIPCSVCHLYVCATRTTSQTTKLDNLLQRVQEELGISLTQTINERHRCEVKRLATWCLEQKGVISLTGEFDPDRVILHDTSCTLTLAVKDPKLQARPDRCNPQSKLDIAEMVRNNLRQGIIEKSNAPWSSNCVVIRKDGKTRIAVDYRKLNEVTVRDNYLLPKIQEIYETLSGTQWFTSVDASQAYHQIPMATERDKDLTSFVTPEGGLYRYKYMPFGLKNAGACWSRFIDGALAELRWDVCLVYADDCLIYTKFPSVDEHIKHLNQVFARLRANGVNIKGSKVKLGVKELPFLGQIINKHGYRPDPNKIKAVIELQPPSNVHQLRRVLGLFAYYRKYIPNFAEIASPLYSLTGKNVQAKRDSQRRIHLNGEQSKAFETLKQKLTTEPVFLAYPRWDCPFEIHCDSSKLGIAAVLTQIVDKQERVLMYASRALNDAEQRYIPYEQESLAMVWSIDLFKHYLRDKPFIVRSDCQALQWLKDKQPKGARINKWLLRLQEFDYKVIHRPGSKSANCDGLTRQPLAGEDNYGEQDPFELLPPPQGDVVHAILTRKQKAKLDSRTLLEADTPSHESERWKTDTSGLDYKHRDEEDEPTTPAPRKRARMASSDIPDNEGGHGEEWIPPTHESMHHEGEELSPSGDDIAPAENPFFTSNREREGCDMETWTCEQNFDTHITTLREKIAVDPKLAEMYITLQGVLHKKASISDQHTSARDRIVVPESLKAFVLGQHHNLELHGHQGRKRTTTMVCNRYHWPHMRKDIARWVGACSGCKRRKTPRPMNSGLTEIALATEPWRTVGIDIQGPLPTTADGYKWILTIVDQFSRWPLAIPLRTRTSTEIATALFQHLITVHGTPKVILSDMGKELISQGIKQLCTLWGVRKVATGGYNPQGNAFCERFHRYLNSAITILKPGNEDTPGWDMLIHAVLFSYRCSTNDATGYSPYFLLNGREPRLPDELNFSPENDNEPEYVEEYVAKIHQNLKQAFELARQQQYASAVENYERANHKTNPDFKVNDLLYLWEHSSKESHNSKSAHEDERKVRDQKLPKKWTNPWTGPYPFLKFVSARRAVILKNGKEETHNVNRLTKHTSWDSVNPDTNEWCLQNKKRTGYSPASVKPLTGNEPLPVPDTWVFLPGEIFVIPMSITEENTIPFGIGKVISHIQGENIHFQWLGNSTQNRMGKFEPAWFQKSTLQHYYQNKPQFWSHPAYTGLDLEVFVKAQDVILESRDRPFLENSVIKTWARNYIYQHVWVQQAIEDFKNENLE